MSLHPVAVAIVVALASIASHEAHAQQPSKMGDEAHDFLLLRDGDQKRGQQAVCDRNICRLGTEVVPRESIEWIGLGRLTPTPPPVRDPIRDELHLVDLSVQAGTLAGIDSDRVYTATVGAGFTATSAVRRERVAWIHLGQTAKEHRPPPQGAGSEPDKSEPYESNRDEESGDDRADVWRVPPRVFIWAPRSCPTCSAHLLVLDLVGRDGAVYLTKSRAIEISDRHLSGNWRSYDPPPRLFPGTIATKSFGQDYSQKTWLTVHYYLENRGDSASGGSRAPGTAGSPPRASRDRATDPVDQPLGDPIGRAREGIEDWARERIAQDRAAEDARRSGRTGGAGQAGGRGSRQYGEMTGVADIVLTLLMTNWQIVADEEISRRLLPDWERYRRLKDIPLYDVDVGLRFSFRDFISRGRDVDRHGYTTDYASGPTRQRGPGRPTRDVYAPSPSPESTTPADPVERLLGDAAQRLRDRAEQWARERLSESGARNGDAPEARPGADRAAPIAGGLQHAVSLQMRWYRADGRVTQYNHSDIIKDVLDGQSEYEGAIVATTLPDGAFDMQAPPSWPAPNPKPSRRAPEFNWKP